MACPFSFSKSSKSAMEQNKFSWRGWTLAQLDCAGTYWQEPANVVMEQTFQIWQPEPSHLGTKGHWKPCPFNKWTTQVLIFFSFLLSHVALLQFLVTTFTFHNCPRLQLLSLGDGDYMGTNFLWHTRGIHSIIPWKVARLLWYATRTFWSCMLTHEYIITTHSYGKRKNSVIQFRFFHLTSITVNLTSPVAKTSTFYIKI